MSRLDLTAEPRILVVALRRLGDVLLTTPLIRSLRRAWPRARIEALVFADTAGILDGNPDLDAVIATPANPSAAQTLRLGARLLRRYDLAVSTQSGDRPTGFAIVAGRASVAPVADNANGRIKRALLTRSIAVQPGLHRVEDILRLADVLGIARVPEIVCPRAAALDAPAGAYAVIHAAPMFRYKQWTAAGWRDIAAALAARGLTVIATGGPAAAEHTYLDEVWAGTAVMRCDGQLSWPQLAGLLARASVYVGPDTSVTHLAAAAGCPAVAIYGPTDPRLWGPWPAGGMDDVWAAASTLQRRGNVWLVQNPLPCMPCQLEGCERRLDSDSQCLVELPAANVLAALDQALAEKR
jgi:heptosyltransferase-3